MKRNRISSWWLAVLLAFSSGSAGADSEIWDSYLDYAYVFSSAESEALKARLSDYGQEAGMSLPEYVRDRYETATDTDVEAYGESDLRRKAIAYLLLYLAEGEPRHLDTSTEAARELRNWLSRHENRYWYHYILAHRAMEQGHYYDFVGEVLDVWLQVVVPLETPYEMLHTLSLSDSPNSGFVSAIPYIYENLARMILIRSQQMRIDRELDPLAAIVRLLHDGRVGAQPDVIPPEASSRDYIARIIERLDGPESDSGSLTFTLALFEASKLHEAARGLLATEGFSAESLNAIRVASGGYAAALNRANTLQGEAAVYTRVLRQMGEVYAAKQRLGENPEIDSPFSIEGAIDVLSYMSHKVDGGWEEIGYRRNGRQAYIDAMHGLWEEIQEVSLTAADYYLAQSLEQPIFADEHSRNAARIYTRYLALFGRFGSPETREMVPDSAFFAAYEAARGYGDAMLGFAQTNPTPDELNVAATRYATALELYPFEATTWPALTNALERQGRESNYIKMVRPIADSVAQSRHIDQWISGGGAGSATIAAYRDALADNLAIMNLGFAESGGIDRLRAGLVELRTKRDALASELATLTKQASPPAAIDDSGQGTSAARRYEDPVSMAARKRRIEDITMLVTRLDKQLKARSRSFPLYKAVVDSEDLTNQLRVQRDHTVHTLLRRMYFENRSERKVER